MGLVNIFSRLELGYKWDGLQHPKYWCISGLVKCLVIMISGCNIFLVCGSPTPAHSQFTTSSAAWQYSLFLFFNFFNCFGEHKKSLSYQQQFTTLEKTLPLKQQRWFNLQLSITLCNLWFYVIYYGYSWSQTEVLLFQVKIERMRPVFITVFSPWESYMLST